MLRCPMLVPWFLAMVSGNWKWIQVTARFATGFVMLDEGQVHELTTFARDWITHHRATEVTGGNNP